MHNPAMHNTEICVRSPALPTRFSANRIGGMEHIVIVVERVHRLQIVA
jgi:hypothetical protein